jgi:hypothetical protein
MKTEFTRKNRNKSYIQSLAMTHHAKVRKLLSMYSFDKSPLF